MEAYPDTYQAHPAALDIELAEAERLGRLDWVARRCRDLASYLDDPFLPLGMEDTVNSLISRYCGGSGPAWPRCPGPRTRLGEAHS